MQQKLNILDVVEGCRCRRSLVCLLLVLWLAWVDTLENAETSMQKQSSLNFQIFCPTLLQQIDQRTGSLLKKVAAFSVPADG